MNIFIDSSIIIQENYFTGKKLERLGTLSNQGVLNLFFTTVIDNEIISNINSECEKLFQAQKTFKRQLETKYRVIKNLYKPSELGIINEDYFLPALLDKYKRFKEFANIEIIKPNNEFNISDIINNYFEKKPPFDNSHKKSEFPDALSFKIAEDYLKSKNLSGIYLTVDKDFQNLKSDNLIIKNDINELLENIIRELNPKIFDNKAQILNAIKTDLNLFIPGIKFEIELDLLMHHEDVFGKYNMEISVEKQNTLEVNIDEYEVFDISENSVGFKCKGNFISELFYAKKDGEEKEMYDKIIEFEKLDSNGLVKYKGDFETTCYYEYEFPYQVIKESVEIEEEKLIKNITRI